MPVTISDEMLVAMRMDAREAAVEIACRLFDAGRLSFGHAAKMAGVSEEQLHDEIQRRGIPRYRYTAEHLTQDLNFLQRMTDREKAGR